MYFDYQKAIFLVKEGHKMTRECWDNSYIFNNTNNKIMFAMERNGIDKNNLLIPYEVSYSDVTANDWKMIA